MARAESSIETLLTWPMRALAALVLLAIVALAIELHEGDGQPSFWHKRSSSVGHLAAATAQQGQPTTAAEALAAIDHDLVQARADAASSRSWMARSGLGDLLLARARLIGSYADYAEAGHAFDSAFAIAPAGSGPHLERAGWNFAVHRLEAAARDLAPISRYAVPDDGVVAAAIGLHGDLLFYRGRYGEALAAYQASERKMPGLGSDMRLANYYARFGAPDRSLALLDVGEQRISGPQQQLRAYVELRRGIIELARGNWDVAETRFRRADDIFPGYWIVEEQLATVLALKGKTRDAAIIFRQIAERDGQPDGFDGLAGLERATGQVADARRDAAKAEGLWRERLRILPEAALSHAIDHMLAFGDPSEALHLAQQNYALRPYGDAATALASAYLQNHRAAEALRILGPLFAAGWKSAEAHVVASEAHALLGDGDAADTERDAALSINPHALDRNPGMTWLEQ